MLLLGISFQLSMAATNVFFYLLVVSGVVLTALAVLRALPAAEITQIKKDWRQLLRSPLWLIVTLWVVLLYVSISYSEANERLWEFARKYLKYTLLGFIVIVVMRQQRAGVDLPKHFFIGFAVGGAIVFGLGVLNKSTGWLTQAAVQGWVPEKYVVSGYWISNEWFAHSLFMAVLFAYGLTGWLRKHELSYLIFCAVGLFGIFVVSEQRTGFMATIVVTLWLVWLLLPTLKQKILATLAVIAVITLVVMTDNSVMIRVAEAGDEWQRCMAVADSADLQTLGQGCYSSIGLRVLFLKDSLAQIGDAWLFGHGLGNLQVVTIDYDWYQQAFRFGQANNPHNEYLLQGIQLGLVGVILVIALFVVAFYQAMHLNRNRRYLYAGIVLMYALGCLFNSFLLDPLQGMLFTLLMAFIITDGSKQRSAV